MTDQHQSSMANPPRQQALLSGVHPPSRGWEVFLKRPEVWHRLFQGTEHEAIVIQAPARLDHRT